MMGGLDDKQHNGEQDCGQRHSQQRACEKCIIFRRSSIFNFLSHSKICLSSLRMLRSTRLLDLVVLGMALVLVHLKISSIPIIKAHIDERAEYRCQ